MLTLLLRITAPVSASTAAQLSPETIESVLRHVGYGVEVGSVWVASDGRYQVGPLHGAWSKAGILDANVKAESRWW